MLLELDRVPRACLSLLFNVKPFKRDVETSLWRIPLSFPGYCTCRRVRLALFSSRHYGGFGFHLDPDCQVNCDVNTCTPLLSLALSVILYFRESVIPFLLNFGTPLVAKSSFDGFI